MLLTDLKGKTDNNAQIVRDLSIHSKQWIDQPDRKLTVKW